MRDLWQNLLSCCKAHDSLLIAFSGGVDSTLLAHAARQALGPGRVMLAFYYHQLITPAEEEQARQLAQKLQLPLLLPKLDILSLPEVGQNSRQRCYACKKAMLSHLWQLAQEQGLAALAEGSNADDFQAGNRPGSRAAAELGVAQPLAQAGLTKAQVRQLALEQGLPNHSQPARPCLATRFPYDTALTPALLAQVSAGEQALGKLGLKDFRLRSHGNICRIEACPEDMKLLLGQAEVVQEALQDLGWTFVTMDLGGLISGRFDLPGNF